MISEARRIAKRAAPHVARGWLSAGGAHRAARRAPGSAPALTTANVSPISQTPADADQIKSANDTVTIPD